MCCLVWAVICTSVFTSFLNYCWWLWLLSSLFICSIHSLIICFDSPLPISPLSMVNLLVLLPSPFQTWSAQHVNLFFFIKITSEKCSATFSFFEFPLESLDDDLDISLKIWIRMSYISTALFKVCSLSSTDCGSCVYKRKLSHLF